MNERVYLASPLGFSPEYCSYLKRVKEKIAALGFAVFDPWEQKQTASEIEKAFRLTDFAARIAEFRNISAKIGAINEEGIRSCKYLLAILDGTEVDSGTASELGFASALGKKCYGLRTDIRDCGDFVGVAVNLQLFTSLKEVEGDFIGA